jgi:1-deoxy-D-xylulose-5-phosphate synthase
VALRELAVIFCLDRAGLVGEDGATHHGVFDLAYLQCIPNIMVYAPLNEVELRNMLYTAQLGLLHPIAIRYPRGRGVILNWKRPYRKLLSGRQRLKNGSKAAVLSTGAIGNNVTAALQHLNNADTIAHYDFAFVKPLDEKLLHELFATFDHIITIEDGAIQGGFGNAIAAFATTHQYTASIQMLGVPDRFIEQGTVAELQQICGLDVGSIQLLLEKYL